MMSANIYLIDDSNELLFSYSMVLKKYGITHCFSSPKEFLDYISTHSNAKPDLVIMDYNMPEMNGIEMVESAQRLGIYFPSLLISGLLEKADILRANEVGIWRILEKPISVRALVGAVQDLLRVREYQQIRNQLRETTIQLREMFAAFQLLVMDELTVGKKELSSPQGTTPMTMEAALLKIEDRLDELTKAEIDLESNLKAAQLSRVA